MLGTCGIDMVISSMAIYAHDHINTVYVWYPDYSYAYLADTSK